MQKKKNDENDSASTKQAPALYIIEMTIQCKAITRKLASRKRNQLEDRR